MTITGRDELEHTKFGLPGSVGTWLCVALGQRLVVSTPHGDRASSGLTYKGILSRNGMEWKGLPSQIFSQIFQIPQIFREKECPDRGPRVSLGRAEIVHKQHFAKAAKSHMACHQEKKQNYMDRDDLIKL